MRDHRITIVLALIAATGCGGVQTDDDRLGVGADGGVPAPTGVTASSCTSDEDCDPGLTCLGRAGGPEAENPRFTGGYCTRLGCTAESQDGCGPDEWCIDAGFSTMCVPLCSKADGLTCERPDHVCLGLGYFGGCFARTAVECDVPSNQGCGEAELCTRIGFEDSALGRCETLCDPMSPTSCDEDHACYYIRRYQAAICNTPGTTPPEELCSCDKCCEPGFACTPDVDGSGRHCKALCSVAEGCPDAPCVPLLEGSPWGGCVAPGSSGT
jgi:hypothetical protein